MSTLAEAGDRVKEGLTPLLDVLLERQANINKIVLASMDAIQDFFFWTWRIGVSKTRGCESRKSS